MNINIVLTVFEFIESGLHFSLEIGVDIAGGTLHLADVHIGAGTDSLDKVDGRNHRALKPVFDVEVVKHGFFALTPKPDMGGGTLALAYSLEIDGMIFKHLAALFHHFDKLFCALVPIKIGADNAAAYVMRRGERSDVDAAAFPHKAMAVAHAGIKTVFFV